MNNEAFLAGYLEKKATEKMPDIGKVEFSPSMLLAGLVNPAIGATIASLMAREGKGWQGAGYGALQGMGIPMGMGAGLLAGGLAGAGAGGLVGGGAGALLAPHASLTVPAGAAGGAIAGAIPGALAGGGYGAYKGGKYAHDLIRQMVGEKWLSDVFGT